MRESLNNSPISNSNLPLCPFCKFAHADCEYLLVRENKRVKCCSECRKVARQSLIDEIGKQKEQKELEELERRLKKLKRK